MARRPLPRILNSGSASITRGREFARTAADNATDVLHPLIRIVRGLRLLAGAGRRKWAATPKERRNPTLFLVAACVLVVALIPYGPLLALAAVMGAAAWKGRERTPVKTGPDKTETGRLQALYEALVPYLSVADDPSPLFAHGGDWGKAFSGYEFDGDGRVTRLKVAYPAYFTDGEAASRTRIEQLLHTKSGRGREYHFAWDEEANQLVMSVLDALPTSIAAQRFVTTPGETVLGFTDDDAVQRKVPVTDGEETRDAPPVVWRTGARSTEPHLLIVGQPGSGTSTLMRSIALQALQHGDILIIEGSGTGEYGCLTGRTGVLAVECGLAGALATLEWAGHETERRLIAANRARQAGHPPPEDTKRPLWILLDRPSVLGHLAAVDGRPDPQELLQVPLRHGRAANVTVVTTDQFDSLDTLSETVRTHTRARVVLGPCARDQVESVLGLEPHTTPPPDVPPGRGYARLGTGPVLRLQVPATPDPYDDATSEAHRQAVLDLLPAPQTAVEATVPEPTSPDPLPAETALTAGHVLTAEQLTLSE
ncbi:MULTISPECIES: ATP-binding protein [unclassified Streptomyces]|uniref:ATP-binding protein n=1 Tax=unclassified Streptomyces TaxID=2593676 RepID=UPI002DDB9A42|nr:MULTISPECIES: ATP-binding protein [unclassified Streptomyces]WSF88000.1 ATP-binding protein [Streptomyces sp. NBC_01744]WSC35763.1 ATP-binding protein [Streptomyces sp. NBC_01763]WSC43893.1 ATP-binding protein [Streptomyces sp. NBC_01762]WSC57154.1 ATP-binding protein [Streptomyces sp. NBC_01761]WSD23480.1 ATP-binding protein [Streptomyces sp. NBC_01751]